MDDALRRTIAELEATLGADVALSATIRPVEPVRPTGLLPALDLTRGDLALGARLGAGGMGEVLAAHQRSLGRDVAVKRLVSASPGAAASLVREARTMGTLEHPAVVPVHALGMVDGSPVLVMKRIDGVSLATLIERSDHPAWADLERRHGDRILALLDVLARVADALELAHARGVFHRDIKPANVMVGAFGETYLLDWGIAVAPGDLSAEERGATAIVGTPCMMAPEMVGGRLEDVDARTDVYLLGATLHAVLTGRPRHAGTTLPEVIVAAAVSDPPELGPEVPPPLAELVRRSTAREKAHRPASVTAFRDALTRFRVHKAALERTSALEARLDGLGPLEGARLADPAVIRTLGEVRTGLALTLAEWSENEAARAALERTLRALVEVELARESPEAVRALLDELPAAPELRAKLDALVAAGATRDALAARARRDAIEDDPTVRGASRALFLLGVALVSAIVSVASFAQPAADEEALVAAIANDAVQLVLVALALAALRRWTLATRWARRFSAMLLGAGAMLVVSSTAIWLRAGTEADAMHARNLILASAFTAAGVLLSPRFLAAAAVAVIAALASAVRPDLLGAANAVTVGAGVLASIWASVARRGEGIPSAPAP